MYKLNNKNIISELVVYKNTMKKQLRSEKTSKKVENLVEKIRNTRINNGTFSNEWFKSLGNLKKFIVNIKSEKQLDKYADNKNEFVNLYVALNPNISLKSIKKLMNNKHKIVRKTAEESLRIIYLSNVIKTALTKKTVNVWLKEQLHKE